MMNTLFIILDCAVNDGKIYVDNTCVTLQTIPPYNTKYGSNITFRCKSRLLQQSVAGFKFCPLELCTPEGWTDGYISCARKYIWFVYLVEGQISNL